MLQIEKYMSNRMGMICDSVKECGSVYDTGSDHAFVPIYLIGKGICKKAIASDIRIGPIIVAEKNIKKFGMDNEISTSNCDGIANAGGFECIIIAGMGSQLIVDILEKESKIARNAEQLILQPMNAPEKLREYLWENGFSIYSENLCREKHKVYNVICARYTGLLRKYSEFELHASELLVKEKHPLIAEYLKPKIRRLKDMIKGGNNPENKISSLLEELEDLLK